MDFQVVVLAGGTSKALVPLVSKEAPKALLPVANRPVISYVLDLLEQNNLNDIIVVVGGDDAAVKVGGWISSAYVDRLRVEIMKHDLETPRKQALWWPATAIKLPQMYITYLRAF